MTAKQHPHSPAGTRLEPPDEAGIYRILIPSESRPGRAHELRVLYTGEAVGCTCEGHAAFLEYRATRHTPGTPPARRDCWHMEAAGDLLSYHLDPPPADPGPRGLPPGNVIPALLDLEEMSDDEARELGFPYWTPANGPPPADPGGAALDAGQVDVDGEIGDWILGGKLSPPPWLLTPPANPLDAAVEASGDRWLVSRTPPRATLTCRSCAATYRFDGEDKARQFVELALPCDQCGAVAGPTPPGHGAARKPLSEHLDLLYGSE